jgi:hypothetical protein
MIRVTGLEPCVVAKTNPAKLVLFKHTDPVEWLPCLSVKYGDEVTLLALKFRDPHGGAPSPFLLKDIAEQTCWVIGRAEFYLTYPSPPFGSIGHLFLGSTGAAVIGTVQGKEGSMEREAWLLKSGEKTAIETDAPRPTAWEVGVMNDAGVFEAVLAFPYK